MNDHEIIQPIGQSHARWRPPFRALPVLADDHFSCLSLQRFRGKLCGRERTFVLQGSEIVGNGKIKAIWSVLPGSGTGDLSGLRGEGGLCRPVCKRVRRNARILVRMM